MDMSSRSCIISHAGDGNFHVAIMFDPQSREEVEEAERLASNMVHTALSMEGELRVQAFAGLCRPPGS